MPDLGSIHRPKPAGHRDTFISGDRSISPRRNKWGPPPMVVLRVVASSACPWIPPTRSRVGVGTESARTAQIRDVTLYDAVLGSGVVKATNGMSGDGKCRWPRSFESAVFVDLAALWLASQLSAHIQLDLSPIGN